MRFSDEDVDLFMITIVLNFKRFCGIIPLIHYRKIAVNSSEIQRKCRFCTHSVAMKNYLFPHAMHQVNLLMQITIALDIIITFLYKD